MCIVGHCGVGELTGSACFVWRRVCAALAVLAREQLLSCAPGAGLSVFGLTRKELTCMLNKQ